MRRLFALLLILLLVNACACAEALDSVDLGALEEFAREYADGMDVRGAAEAAFSGKSDFDALLDWLKGRIAGPLREMLAYGTGLLAPALLLTLLSCMGSGRGGARFLVLLTLISGILQAAAAVMESTGECLRMVSGFADAAAPAMGALMTAAGMTSSAALLSPAAAIIASLMEKLFLSWGMPLCRVALCLAAAGSLTEAFDLSRAAKLTKKILGWGTGLCFTLFTAAIALQGSMASSLDGMALRTAKYAVDSAAPVIGSGVSDVWESYVSGIQAARSAVGVSGVALLLAAGLRPLLQAGAGMLMLQVLSVLLDVFGERQAARAAEQAGDVCRMALELCCSAMAIAVVLLGAGMTLGRGMLGP